MNFAKLIYIVLAVVLTVGLLWLNLRFYYPRSSDYVDSGPLIFGVSLSATVVTLGGALVHGDHLLAEPLRHSGEVLGLPITWDNKKRYAFGMMPVGDAFLVWSKNARPWLAPSTRSGSASQPPVASWWWRLPWHGVSLLLIVGLWWRLKRWSDPLPIIFI